MALIWHSFLTLNQDEQGACAREGERSAFPLSVLKNMPYLETPRKKASKEICEKRQTTTQVLITNIGIYWLAASKIQWFLQVAGA